MNWFTKFEFWADLNKIYGTKKVQEVISNAENENKKNVSFFSKDQMELWSLLLEKYTGNNVILQEAPEIESDVPKTEIEKLKNYVMDKVQSKICIPFSFEQNIGQTKTSLFSNIRNEYYRKAPDFFDLIIYENWFCTPQFWVDFEKKYGSKTMEEIKDHGEEYKKKILYFQMKKKENGKRQFWTK